MRHGASVVATARPRDDSRNASIEARRDRIARLMAVAAVRAVLQSGTQEPRHERAHPDDVRANPLPANDSDAWSRDRGAGDAAREAAAARPGALREGRDGTKAGVVANACLWADLDEGGDEALAKALVELERGELLPTLIVRSSPGKHHL